MSRHLVRNALVNVGRGVASAIVAIVVPPVLIHHMEPASYAVWVLVLQVISYMGFVDFGLQTAVGRYVAYTKEKQDTAHRDAIYSTAFAGLSLAALFGFSIIFFISIQAGHIFPSIPANLLPPMRLAMLIAGFSAAIGLPASAWNGIFIGLQRYEIPAGTIAVGKLLTSLGLILAALTGKSLVLMGIIVAVVNLATYAVQFGLLRRIFPQIHFHFDSIRRETIRELFQYCITLAIWSISTFIIAGMDLMLVGHFEFKAVTPYSAAAVLISFFGGLQVSIFNVIMPHAASLYAANEAKTLGDLLLKATRLGFFLLLITGLPLIVCASDIIRLWIGTQFAVQGSTILVILVIANIFRLVSVPYSSILLGTGQQGLILISPIIECISNLAASIVLGIRYGAIGVAYGTLIGSVIGVMFHIFYNLPRTRDHISISPARMLTGLTKPLVLCLWPFLIVAPIELARAWNIRFLWWIALSISVLSGLISVARSYLHKNRSEPVRVVA